MLWQSAAKIFLRELVENFLEHKMKNVKVVVIGIRSKTCSCKVTIKLMFGSLCLKSNGEICPLNQKETVSEQRLKYLFRQ